MGGRSCCAGALAPLSPRLPMMLLRSAAPHCPELTRPRAASASWRRGSSARRRKTGSGEKIKDGASSGEEGSQKLQKRRKTSRGRTAGAGARAGREISLPRTIGKEETGAWMMMRQEEEGEAPGVGARSCRAGSATTFGWAAWVRSQRQVLR